MESSNRISLARRQAGLFQAQLARNVGVQRSAVSHWESSAGKNPCVQHLRAVAVVTGVRFEWLVTGRGAMAMSPEAQLDSIPTARALLVDDALELRLLDAIRTSPLKTRLLLVELAEILARQRTGVRRGQLLGDGQVAVMAVPDQNDGPRIGQRMMRAIWGTVSALTSTPTTATALAG